ncbi:unnamed protein product [Withania somnifera]
MWSPKKLQLPSFLSSFSSILAFLIFIPLVLVSVLACTLGPQGSYYYHYLLLGLGDLYEEKYQYLKLIGLVTFNNSFHQKLAAKDSLSNRPLGHSDKTPGINKRYTRLERLEAILAKARSFIREAARNGSMVSNHQDPDCVPQGLIYRYANASHRSYCEMEKNFKMYAYEEGELPIFHNGPCRSIYSTEGMFIYEMEKGNIYRTKYPEEVLVYFLPFSVVVMVRYLYVSGALDKHVIAIHFICATSLQQFHKSSMHANTSEGFNPQKDVSLPEINLKTGDIIGLIGGLSHQDDQFLLSLLLMQQWKGKDQDVLVYEKLPEGKSYKSMLKNSRFCLCPSGYEVASLRVVEAIYAECVPVLISDGYVPPFSDVLNWKAFSVKVAVKDIPNIKKILMSISQNQYLRMPRRVKQVQRFDLFHMIVLSIWLKRLNIRVQD